MLEWRFAADGGTVYDGKLCAYPEDALSGGYTITVDCITLDYRVIPHDGAGFDVLEYDHGCVNLFYFNTFSDLKNYFSQVEEEYNKGFAKLPKNFRILQEEES